MSNVIPRRDRPVGGAGRLVPREHFPLTDRVTYLNSAGLGLVPLPIIERHAALAREIGQQGTLAYFANEAEIKQAPREAAAQLLGAHSDSIAIVMSTSEVISQLAWWLRPRSGQNVVVIDVESAAVIAPWLRVAQETGAEIRVVRTIADPAAICIERIAELVDHRTAAIAVSHVQWGTGYRFDLAQLAELAHAHGALLVVDAMQSAGVVPINVAASGVDVLAAGSFKWLCAFAGTGVCYVRPELAERWQPILAGSLTSWPALPYTESGVSNVHDIQHGARRLEYASSTHTLRVALNGSIRYLLDVGIASILSHVQALTARLADGMRLLDATILTPNDEAHRAGILTARFPGQAAAHLVAELAKHNVVTLERLGGVRFSPHLFNTGDDIDRALAALEEIAR